MPDVASPNPPKTPGGLGASLNRIDGPAKVTGQARYASDMPVTRPAYAYFRTSDIARGRITAIDEAETRALPGVLHVMTWKNTAGQLKSVKPFSEGGSSSTAINPLEGPEIRHDGEIVAVVIAETFEAARDGAHRLKVRYDEAKPSSTFGSAGLKSQPAGAVDPRFKDAKVGDAAGAFAKSAVKVDQRYATPTQHHNPIELFTTTCAWNGDELTIYEPCQFMVGFQHGMAEILNMPPEKVRAVSLYVGGAFGSKGFAGHRQGLVALAAKRVGRPVKLVVPRDQGFTLATYRAETRHHVKLGASRDGKIAALIHEGEEITSRTEPYKVAGTETTTRMYAIPNVASKVTVVHADRNTPGFMRSPPEVPYMFALESAMDELAYELGMDPVELRRINDAKVEPIEGRPYSSRSLMQCYDAAAKGFGWSRRDPRPGSMRDGDWLIGWGCATACYPANIAPSFARVTLNGEGALVEVAGHEIGTGAYTIYAQTAAEELGLPVARVQVRLGDSRLPPAPVAGGSNNAASICNAVVAACRQVRQMVAAAAAADPRCALAGCEPATLRLTGGALEAPDGRRELLTKAVQRVGGAVEALGGNEPPNVPPGSLAGLRQGRFAMGGGTHDKDFVKYAFGAEFVEVRVHARTREVRCPRMVGAFAAGRILNAKTARSQLLGGMIWGVSSALHEATEIDTRRGRYANDNLAEYLVPVNADIDKVEVIMLPETDTHVNPLGIKGVGELGNVGTNAAVANAVFHATGVRIRELPVRIEKLL